MTLLSAHPSARYSRIYVWLLGCRQEVVLSTVTCMGIIETTDDIQSEMLIRVTSKIFIPYPPRQRRGDSVQSLQQRVIEISGPAAIDGQEIVYVTVLT